LSAAKSGNSSADRLSPHFAALNAGYEEPLRNALRRVERKAA
jgi:hypothetical protein